MNLTAYLTQNYPEISKAIASEGYNIDYDEFDEIVEIDFEDKTVGFISLADSDFFNTRILTDAYVIDKYRGSNLFFKKFTEYISNGHSRILFRKPTHAFMEVLVHNGLAYRFSDDFAVSFINFLVTVGDAYKNSKIKRLYKKIPQGMEDTDYLADLFDLSMNCVVVNDYMELAVKDIENFIIIEPRKYDLKKYNLRKKLKKITPKYMENISFNYGVNLDMEEARDSLNENFNSFFRLDNIVGTADELKEDFVEFLKENNLSTEDGFKIRRSICESLESGEITQKSIIRRLTYLAKNIDMADSEPVDKPLMCPFCKIIATNQLGMCKECGHEFEEAFPEDDIAQILEMENPDDFFNRDMDFSVKDNDFMEQFHDFSEKLDAILGGDRTEFFDSIQEGDFARATEIMEGADDNLKNIDWYVEEGNRLDNGLLKLIEEKNYDADEVFEAQSRITEYELVKHMSENVTSWKVPEYGRLNHVFFDYYDSCIDKGYLEPIDSDEFKVYFARFSEEELEQELKYFDIEAEHGRDAMIKQLADVGNHSLAVTEKGYEYLNDDPLCAFFASNMADFLFYEFEKYFRENEGDLRQISEKYVTGEFKKAVVKGDLDVYLSYLNYYYNISLSDENYEDCIYYLLQMFIYEANRWDMDENRHGLDRIFSRNTQTYFNDLFLMHPDADFDEIYDRAFRQFKFSHMKNHKELLRQLSRRLLDGEHIVSVKEDLVEELMD